MRILVLGLDSPLGYSLRSFAAPLMRHEIVGVDMDTSLISDVELLDQNVAPSNVSGLPAFNG